MSECHYTKEFKYNTVKSDIFILLAFFVFKLKGLSQHHFLYLHKWYNCPTHHLIQRPEVTGSLSFKLNDPAPNHRIDAADTDLFWTPTCAHVHMHACTHPHTHTIHTETYIGFICSLFPKGRLLQWKRICIIFSLRGLETSRIHKFFSLFCIFRYLEWFVHFFHLSSSPEKFVPFMKNSWWRKERMGKVWYIFSWLFPHWY